MAQTTLVLKVPASEREALRRALSTDEFQHRRVPYALFSVKGAGVVATLYRTGKFVVQGEDPGMFAERFLGPGAKAAPPRASRAARADEEWPLAGDWVGSDECGKGDYFGPLVVAGVRLTEDEVRSLAGGPVTDSKLVGDENAKRLGAALRGRFPHAVRWLDPADYNARHRSVGNVNLLLADLHGEVLRELYRPGHRVLVDQFTKQPLVAQRVPELAGALLERPRAEAHPVVAAASLIAREAFLSRLAELSDEIGMDLHKGAGPPVDRVGRQLVARFGPEVLERVAKRHFKNTLRVVGAR